MSESDVIGIAGLLAMGLEHVVDIFSPNEVRIAAARCALLGAALALLATCLAMKVAL